jgi:long-chain acyl-CoA synthetase
LRDGKVLRLNELEPEVVAAPRKVFTPSEVAERVVHSLPSRFRVDEYQKDITWYFSLGGKDGPRWCLMVREDGVTIKAGRPDGSADCVVKTSVDMFRRIVEEGYTPEPAEFMSGAVKTSDLALLLEFRQVFHLSEVQS